MDNSEKKIITTANASQCTPYELRQTTAFILVFLLNLFLDKSFFGGMPLTSTKNTRIIEVCCRD